ncbi:hypothetical protein, partial [uncultured Cetobacterium sp.]
YSYDLDDLDIKVGDGFLNSKISNNSSQYIQDDEMARITIRKDYEGREDYGDRFIRYELFPRGRRVQFKSLNGRIANDMEIDRIYLKKKVGNIDRNYLTFDYKGRIELGVGGVFRIGKNLSLNGEYVSDPITLKLWKDDEVETVIFKYYVNVLGSLELKTEPMYLGKGIRGDTLSSKRDGFPGILYIKGKPGEEVEIEYPKKIFIYNQNRRGKLEVDINSNLRDDDEGDDEVELNYRGTAKVEFNGMAKDTRGASSGIYSGTLLIKVRYD